MGKEPSIYGTIAKGGEIMDSLKDFLRQCASTYAAYMANTLDEKDAGAEFLASYQQFRDSLGETYSGE